ncbi:MAG TPA: SAM-dependent methyltransferase, partial [Vicinamibacterales bacterium]|nr:SAM-dependent methyltransferase [Vicinamibacterales bacterium]
TPIVSDPGTHLVAAAHAAGIRVEPIPGASAFVAALSASGLIQGEFVFAGFPPSRSKAKRDWFSRLAEETRVIIIYEAPHRIRGTLEVMLETLGDRVILVARELTKAHEQLVVRPISEVLAAELVERGEFTIVISVKQPSIGTVTVPSAADMAREFGVLTYNGAVSRRQALKLLANRYSMPARTVFSLLEEAKTLVE